MIDFLHFMFGYMTRKRNILGVNVFFALNRVFQSLFLKKRKSWVLVSAGCMRGHLVEVKRLGTMVGRAVPTPKMYVS